VVEIHRTARNHGIAEADLRHAVEHAIYAGDLEGDALLPRVLPRTRSSREPPRGGRDRARRRLRVGDPRDEDAVPI